MTTWQHGYYAESGYTYTYFVETAPLHLAWACLLQGHKTPTKQFRYLDAGCGQGLNLILHAAAHPDSEFVGVDFLPEHIAHANRLAAAAKLKNIHFVEADFVELEKDPLSLGQFDYIACHGISTWIAPTVRGSLHSFIGKALRPGGVFYTGYNTFPGWLSIVPFQHLVLLEQRTKSGADALQSAKTLLEKLASSGATFAKTLPQLPTWLSIMKDQESAYLVQEYNNQSWQPMFVTQMIDEMNEVKLSYLGTATLLEAFEGSFPSELQNVLKTEPRVEIREQLRDLGVNQQFRRDLYVKGRVPPWSGEPEAAFSAFNFMANPLMPKPEGKNNYLFKQGTLQITGTRAVYDSILSTLETHKSGASIGTLLKSLKKNDLRGLTRAISNLICGGFVVPAQPENDFSSGKKCNEALVREVCLGAPYRHLSTPGTAGGFQCSDVEMFILRNAIDGVPYERWAESTLSTMTSLNRSIIKDGIQIQDKEQAIKLLSQQIERLSTNKFEFYKTVGVF